MTAITAVSRPGTEVSLTGMSIVAPGPISVGVVGGTANKPAHHINNESRSKEHIMKKQPTTLLTLALSLILIVPFGAQAWNGSSSQNG